MDTAQSRVRDVLPSRFEANFFDYKKSTYTLVRRVLLIKATRDVWLLMTLAHRPKNKYDNSFAIAELLHQKDWGTKRSKA